MSVRPAADAAPDGSDEPPWPDDAVEVARVLGAWGIKGGLKVAPLSGDPQALFSSRRWFLAAPERPSAVPPDARGPTPLPRLLRITQAREQGDAIVATARDIDDRDAAERLRGARIFVARSSFPTAGEGEFYWVDLIGLAVHNREGVCLGTVVGLVDTGPHCVLRIASPPAADGRPGDERLVPFVAAYVDRVSLEERRVDVDWGLDY